MSHFTAVNVDYKQSQEKCLIEGLEEVFGKGSVQVSEEGLPLFGYHGDNRSKLSTSDPNYAPLCHIKIDRSKIGSSSNCIGFRRNDKGTYDAYISEYDASATFGTEKQNKVKQFYTVGVSKRQLKAKGYQVQVKKDKNGQIKIVASKFSK